MPYSPASAAGVPLTIPVNVYQDPVRIAPGETGTMLLAVVVPYGKTRVRPGGRMDLAPTQGPLAFGAPVWDAPKKGRSQYHDTFMVRIPVSVQPNAAHGRYDVMGTLHFTGVFPPAAEGAVTAQEDAAAGVAPEMVPATRTDAVGNFVGKILVGPAVPRPAVRRPSGSAAAGPGAGETGRESDAPVAPVEPREASGSVPTVRTPASASGAAEEGTGVGGVGSAAGFDEPAGGNTWLLVVGAAAAGALLLAWVFLRRS